MTNPLPSDPASLLAQARSGERLALARLLSMVERGGSDARELASLAFTQTRADDGAATGGVAADDATAATDTSHTVGITGAPGSGKSSITSELLAVARKRTQRIAVIAVDPSSPFTGGAILGDRVRMGSHTSDDGVYIRSMASRGQLGGLSLAVPLGARVLAAAGWPWVLIETVGVGQVEVDIAGAADTTVVVVNPGWGDAVQANKAGLMEIADIFVINKSDRPGVSETRMDIVQMLELSFADATDPTGAAWEPPIIETIGTTGQGAPELWDALAQHRDYLATSGLLEQRRQARANREFAELVSVLLAGRVAQFEATPAGSDIKRQLEAGQIDAYTAAEQLLSQAIEQP